MNQAKYIKYTAVDFAMEDDFIHWVKNPEATNSDFWETWVRENPQKAYEVSQAIEIVKSIGFKESHPSHSAIEDVWKSIQKQMTYSAPVHSRIWKSQIGQYLRIAAVLVIGFALGFAFYLTNQGNSDHIDDELFVLKETQNGVKSTFRLPDGTIVKLNADSKLFYSNKFNETEREVELEGEAYFQVTHNKQKPFKVKSDNIVTKVLGTTFNVRAYPEENMSLVALEEGKVQVREIENGEVVYREVLEPSEMLVYNKATRSHKVKEFDVADIMGWKDNAIVFNNSSFPEIKKKLERWYGVSIHASDDVVADFGFTGKFYNESLVNVLDNISMAMDFSYSIENKNVYIKISKTYDQKTK